MCQSIAVLTLAPKTTLITTTQHFLRCSSIMAELEDINIEWKEFVDTSGFPLGMFLEPFRDECSR